MLNTKIIAATAVALGLLSGCFGGGGGDDVVAPPVVQYVPGTDVPVAVETRVDDVISFGKSQIAATAETTEPALLGAAVLATSESADPVDI
jgi:uncharacterized membrane protein YfcA